MICKTLLESLDHSSHPFTYYLFFHTWCLDQMSPPVVGNLALLPVRSSNIILHTYLNQMSQPVVSNLTLLSVRSSNIFLWTIKGTLFNLFLDFSHDNAFQLSGLRLCWHSISQLVLLVISSWLLFLSSPAMLSFLVGGVEKTTMEIKYHFHKSKQSAQKEVKPKYHCTGYIKYSTQWLQRSCYTMVTQAMFELG